MNICGSYFIILFTCYSKYGLNYTVSIANDPKDFTTGSLHTATIRITYTGIQKTNIKFKVGISSDNMPTEIFNFNTANFLSHLQAFLYTNDGSGEVILPENVLALSNGTTFNPCSNETSTGTITAGTFFIGQGQACYLEIKSNSPDKWTYFPVKSSGSEVAPSGYKPTDAINIQVQ